MSESEDYIGRFYPGREDDELPKKPPARRPSRKRSKTPLTAPPIVPVEEALMGLRQAMRESPKMARQLREALKLPAVPEGGEPPK